MALNKNRVQIAGRVGKDPDIREMQNGRMASLRVAVSERWKDKASGEWKEQTEWVPVVVWNDATVGFIEKYVKKGTAVFVEGTFRTRSYKSNDDQKETYVTEVVVRGPGTGLDLVEGFPKREEGGDQPRFDRGNKSGGSGAGRPSGKPSNYDLDDEIPFAPEFRG